MQLEARPIITNIVESSGFSSADLAEFGHLDDESVVDEHIGEALVSKFDGIIYDHGIRTSTLYQDVDCVDKVCPEPTARPYPDSFYESDKQEIDPIYGKVQKFALAILGVGGVILLTRINTYLHRKSKLKGETNSYLESESIDNEPLDIPLHTPIHNLADVLLRIKTFFAIHDSNSQIISAWKADVYNNPRLDQRGQSLWERTKGSLADSFGTIYRVTGLERRVATRRTIQEIKNEAAAEGLTYSANGIRKPTLLDTPAEDAYSALMGNVMSGRTATNEWYRDNLAGRWDLIVRDRLESGDPDLIYVAPPPPETLREYVGSITDRGKELINTGTIWAYIFGEFASAEYMERVHNSFIPEVIHNAKILCRKLFKEGKNLAKEMRFSMINTYYTLRPEYDNFVYELKKHKQEQLEYRKDLEDLRAHKGAILRLISSFK